MYSSLITYAVVGVTESIDRSIPLSERLALGGQTLILGLGTVFSVLALLWGMLEIFRIVFYHPEKTAKAVEVPVQQKEEEPVEESDDGEITAAITAAVAAYIDAENEAEGNSSPSGFRVVSYRKLGK